MSNYTLPIKERSVQKTADVITHRVGSAVKTAPTKNTRSASADQLSIIGGQVKKKCLGSKIIGEIIRIVSMVNFDRGFRCSSE